MNAVFAIAIGLVAATTPGVANPGFEEVSEQTGLPTGWSFTSLPGQSNLVRYEARPASNDKDSKALLITLADNHPQKEVSYNVHQDVNGTVAGKTYRVTANVQTKGLQSQPMIVVQCLDSSEAKLLAFARSPGKTLTRNLESWERIETMVTIPDGTAKVRLRIGIPAAGNSGGTAMIDDVEVVEVR